VIDRAALATALAEIPAAGNPRAEDIEAMTPKGVNHDHFRIRGRGLVLRIPKATPWAGDAVSALASEAMAFDRAAPSGAAPRLAGVLPVSARLARGALVVEEIAGRATRLPGDLPALAAALARLHGLPLPAPHARPPLADHGISGPFKATLAVIARQREYLSRISLDARTRAALDEDYRWAEALAASTPASAQPLALVGTDTHPGNFVIRADGSAVLVDLERACYGSPAIDLAHATLFTSTTWDLEVQGELTRSETEGFYRDYVSAIGTERARAMRLLLAPARRLTWLRTMMWAVRWRALGERNGPEIDPALAAHISRRLDDFFAPSTVARVRAEWLGGPALNL